MASTLIRRVEAVEPGSPSTTRPCRRRSSRSLGLHLRATGITPRSGLGRREQRHRDSRHQRTSPSRSIGTTKRESSGGFRSGRRAKRSQTATGNGISLVVRSIGSMACQWLEPRPPRQRRHRNIQGIDFHQIEPYDQAIRTRVRIAGKELSHGEEWTTRRWS